MLSEKLLEAAGNSTQPVYIEDVFSTYLYTGNGSTQTITNGIDLAGKGGLVWAKSRSSGTYGHQFYDTSRGVGNVLSSNNTNAQSNLGSTGLSVFNSNGFDIGGNVGLNQSSGSMTSWTFRKQPKFFDVVTWTGDGTSNRLIAHNLNSVPGCVIVKCTSTARSWVVAARANDSTYRYLILNGTDAQVGSNSISTYATSTTFNLTAFTNGGRPLDDVNGNGNTYVAYLFAHNAGGFGADGSENVISCGSYTGSATDWAAGATLGYEPQWVLIKNITSGTQNWNIFDNMRGMFVSAEDDPVLFPNLSNAEESYNKLIRPTATGFEVANSSRVGGSGNTCIYIAIRRPMKTPTTGTSVYNADFYKGANSPPSWNTGFVTDLGIWKDRTGGASNAYDRLRGERDLQMNYNGAESTDTTAKFDYMNGWGTASGAEDTTIISWNFRRAPGFFDVVCWTKAGTTSVVNHNLSVVPELIITKCRNRAATYWDVMPNVSPYDYRYNLYLPSTNSVDGPSTSYWGAAPTSTDFSKKYTSGEQNGDTFVAYLFASCSGVSKVFSFTGNGSSQTINCSFTTGARFILIKRTDSTGDWYVWDSARGIVSGNDPHLSLNTTAAEVTTDDTIDPDSTGFIVNQVAATNVNVNAATYIGIAIA